MPRSTSSLLGTLPLLVAALAVATGCASGGAAAGASSALTIESPTDGALLTSRSVRVSGRATDTDLVVVNGVEAEVVDERYTVDVLLEGDGEQRIEASGNGETASVTVRIDETPPQIVVASPAEGAFVEGRAFEVVGRVVDAFDPRLEIDGEAVTLSEDGEFRWSRMVEPGAHRVRLHAVDGAGNEAYAFAAAVVGDFAQSRGRVADAMAVRLGPAAIDELERGAADTLQHLDVGDRVRAANPVATGSWGRIDVNSVTWGTVDVSIAPEAGQVVAGVLMRDLVATFTYDPPLLGGIDGHIEADVNATVTVALGASGGRLRATLVASSVTLDGFSYNIVGVPGFVEGLVRERVRGMLESKFDEALAEMVPGYLERAIMAIPTEDTVMLAGKPIVIGGAFRSVAATGGAIQIVGDFGARAETPLRGRDVQGQILVGGTIGTSTTRDIALAGSLDAANALAHAAWASGALSRRFEGLQFGGNPVTAGALSLVIPGLRTRAPADAPVVIDLDALLPPVVTQGDDGLEVTLPDARATIIAIVDGREERLFTVSVGFSGATTPTLTEGGIGIETSSVDVTADVVEGPPSMPQGERLDGMLDELVGSVAPRFLRFGPMLVPSFHGFGITPTSMRVSDGYVRFEGRMAYTPAPAPVP